MNKIKAFLRSLKLFPDAMATFSRRRQQRSALRELEVERLDRIRHPEKYRGK
jgi:hypothetical protein